jgi:hypothetical protein
LGRERGSFGRITAAVGSLEIFPSRSRKRWNARTEDSVRTTDVARYGLPSPYVEAETAAMCAATARSSTRRASVIPRARRKVAYRSRSRRYAATVWPDRPRSIVR